MWIPIFIIFVVVLKFFFFSGGMEFQLGEVNAQTGVGVAAKMKAVFLTIPGTKNTYYAGTKLSETTGDTKNAVISGKFILRRLCIVLEISFSFIPYSKKSNI